MKRFTRGSSKKRIKTIRANRPTWRKHKGKWESLEKQKGI